MAVDPFIQAEANAALQRWLRDHTEVGGELKETVVPKQSVRQLFPVS